MKTAIICFSQTGNTRKIAEKIRDGMLHQTDVCDLIPLESADIGTLEAYGLVGLGCPVFYFKEPFNVHDFMMSSPQQNGRHWFVFCTHGAVMGQTLFSMTASLKKIGALVIGAHDTYADITVPFYPKLTDSG